MDSFPYGRVHTWISHSEFLLPFVPLLFVLPFWPALTKVMALPECPTILKRDLLFCVDDADVDEDVRILFETGRKEVLHDDDRCFAAGLKVFDCFLPAAA